MVFKLSKGRVDYDRVTDDPCGRVPEPDVDPALAVVNATIALNKAIASLPSSLEVKVNVIDNQLPGKPVRPVVDVIMR